MKKKVFLISSLIFFIIVSIIIFIFLNKNNSYYYDNTIIKNTFEYEQSVTNESIESSYFYSDSYFKKSSKYENEHLRSFSIALAAAFNPTYRKESINYNLNKILEELKFNNIIYYDLEEFGKDTIGTSISHKKLNNKYELVLIVLRGANYQGEWESNLDSGESGNIKGFNDASLVVLSRLNDYLKDNKITDYKLLITGYSRAAAISSLVGVHINDNLDEYKIDDDDLYVYSFESPRYSSSKKKYDNIHNVINKNDIVTYVYPESWGLYHNGIDEDITTISSAIQEKYLDLFSNEKIKNIDYIDKQRFVEKFVNFLPNSREKYYELSDSISNIFNLLNNKNSKEINKIINYFKNIKIDYNINNTVNLLSLINSDNKDSIRKAYDSLLSNYDKEYSKIRDVLNKKEYEELKDDLFNIIIFLQPSIKNDYKSNNMLSMILTFGFNIDEIFKEHYFSTNINEVQRKDGYYNEIPN